MVKLVQVMVGDYFVCVVIVGLNDLQVGGLVKVCDMGVMIFVIDYCVYQGDCVVFEVVLFEFLLVVQFDILCFVGFMCILMFVFVQWFQGWMLNIYFLLLLKYFGLYMYQCVIDVGDVEVGVMVYLVMLELDVGLLLGQVCVLVLLDDIVDMLVVWVLVQEYLLYLQVLCCFVSGDQILVLLNVVQ